MDHASSAEDPSQFFVYTSETKEADIPKETLTHLRVDSSVAEIPDRTFKDCKVLMHLQLPETLTRIGKFTFETCINLRFVQFVSSHDSLVETDVSSNPTLEEGTIVFSERMVLQVDYQAFAFCHRLQKVIVCSPFSNLGEGGPVFSFCDGLISADLPEGLQVINGSFAACGSLTTVRIPSSVIQIGHFAFNACANLTSFELPQGLLEIGEFSFQWCHSIQTLQIPASVSTIGQYAFSDCSGLTHITLPPTLERIEEGVFKGCSRLPAVDLPHGLQEIEESSFQECHAIETLHVPSTVSSIGVSAFEDCSGLHHITLPPTLERIESRMLQGCTLLEYIDIPSTVSVIGDRAFNGCESLSHIRIPPSVESMVPNVFIGCACLISVEVPEGILIVDDEDTEDKRFNVLVNLAIPTLPKDDEVTSGLLYNNSRLGSVVDDEAALLRKLKHRFDNSPLNKLCYYQSYYTPEDAMLQLRSLMEDDPAVGTNQTDEFGMTPLHVLSLSQTPNLAMLLALVNEGNAVLDHMVHRRDSFGSTPMDYLCLNRLPSCTEVIRRVLQMRFDQLLASEGSFKSDAMQQAVDEALAVDWSMRRREIVAIYLKLANYERKEVLSEIELRLWKIKVDEIRSHEPICDRESCRINSGASVVISHILPFLDKLGLDDYFAHYS